MSLSLDRQEARPVGPRRPAWPSLGRAERVDRTDLPAYLLLVLAGIPSQVLSGNSRLLHLPISPDRLLFAGALVLLVVDRAAWQDLRLRLRGVHVLLAAMLALTIWSAAAHGTLRSSLGFYALLDRLFLPFVFFCLAPAFFRTAARRDLLLRVLIVLGLYLGVTAFLEIVGPSGLVLPRYVMNPELGIQYGRARGPFLASEADGLVLVTAGFAAAIGLVRFRGLWRTLSALTLAACLMGVLLTLTRSVWLGAVLGGFVVALMTPAARRWIPVGFGATVAALLLAFAVVPGLQDKVTERAGTQRSVDDRLNVNAAAFRIIEQHPLEGVGWMKFLDEGVNYVRQSPTYPITNVNIEVHNVILGRAAELGLPGALLFVACIVAGPVAAVARRGARGDLLGWRMIATGTLVAWLVTLASSPVPYPLPNLLVWLLTGLVATGFLAEGASDADPRLVPTH